MIVYKLSCIELDLFVGVVFLSRYLLVCEVLQFHADKIRLCTLLNIHVETNVAFDGLC